MKKTVKRGRGRPPIRGEAGQRYQVTVPPGAAKIVRKHGKGSLSAGILWNPAVRREFDRETIRSNEKRIVKLEANSHGIDRQAAMAEARGLRLQNEELAVMIRWDEAWEWHREAFFTLLPQFTPTGNGTPSMEAIDEVEAAERELEAARSEIDRIVGEIRNGQRGRL